LGDYLVSLRSALFDTSFDKFITKRVASALWLLNIIFIFLAGLAAEILLGFSTFKFFQDAYPAQGVVGLLCMVFVVPLLLWLVLIASRLGFEASVALVAVAENTADLRATVTIMNAVDRANRSEVGPPATANRGDDIDTNVAREAFKTAITKRAVVGSGTYTADDLNSMMDDYSSNPREWAQDVLDTDEFTLWINAGEPNLLGWISSGMPSFSKWLK
jgi:uncharacterized membrane protein